MLKVNRRNGFSDRNGIASITTNIQLDDFDERTRNRLLNLVNSVYNDTFEGEEFFAKIEKIFLCSFLTMYMLLKYHLMLEL